MKKIENDNKGNERYQFTSKLLSISTAILQNVNGTQYRVATVEFTGADNKVHTASALVYEKNYGYGMPIDKEYLSTVTLTAQGPLITVSHLQPNADRPTLEMFGFAATAAGTVRTITGELVS